MEEYSSSEPEVSSLEEEEEEDDSSDGEPLVEKCLLGDTVLALPHDLCDQREVFFSVISRSTWDEVLSPQQKAHLSKFLPQFDESIDRQEKDKTLNLLFSGENFRFGNPLERFFTKLKTGFFTPHVVHIRKSIQKAMYREYRFQQLNYYYHLIQEVIISRTMLLDSAAAMPPPHPIRVSSRFSSHSHRPNLVEERTKWRYFNELQKVREECKELDTSEEDENYPDKNVPKTTKKLKKQMQNLESALSPDMTRISSAIPSFLDLGASPLPILPEVTEDRYKELLIRHKRRRQSKESLPELETEGISLDDILTRTNITKRPLVKNEAPPAKKKIKEEPKPSPEGSQPEDEVDIMSDGEERMTPTGLSYPCCFFSLLRDFFYETPEQKMSASKLEEKVKNWQELPTTLEWALLHDNWTEYVPSALKFLAGDLIGIVPENFVPYLDYKEKQQQWQWIGAGRDSEELLGSLCQHWIENREDVFMEGMECNQGAVPPPRVLTDWSVRPTTELEKKLYQDQECVRYQNPHRAFTFRVHGYESVVGPVKGVYGKESGVNKAREHSLLVSDRPPFVTILSLVRDAAARLPNGEGTRADICELLKDSQYLAPANDQQIHTVVSGALDRLHYEKDPCVKYDVNRKLWIYLHRNRTEEEFERIHQAQAAAAKAKKAIQKNKIPRIQKNKSEPESAEPPKGTVSPRTQSSPKPKPVVRSLSLPNTQTASKPAATEASTSQEAPLSMLVPSPNSRPPSQGSLPSPKTVIANVNAAQFVGQNSSEPPHSPSPPVQQVVQPPPPQQPPSQPPISELCPSSPSWVGQPPVLHPPKRTATTTSTVTSQALSGFQTIVIKQEGGKPIATAIPLSAKTKPMMTRVMSLGNLVAKPNPSATATPTTAFRFQTGGSFMQPVVSGTPIQLATTSAKLQAVSAMTSTSVAPKLFTLNQGVLQFDPSSTQTSPSMILTSAPNSTTASPTVLLTTQGTLKPTVSVANTNQAYVMTTPGGSSNAVVMAATQRGTIAPINIKALQGIKVIPMAQAVKGGQHLLARIITPTGPTGQITLRPPPLPNSSPKE